MKYFIGILGLLSILILFFYKQAVFNNEDFKNKYNINLDIKDDYKHFFYLKNVDPIYVFKDNLLKNYAVYTYNNKKSNLIYPNQETIADLDYIWNIQYIWNLRETFTSRFLYNELENITNLSPYRTHIYNLWLLLLPATRYYKWDLNKKLTWENSAKIWEKWIFFTCDKNKIKNILSLSDDKYMKIAYSKTWSFYNANKNPCKDSDVPANLWFNYFQYLRDLKNSVKCYKIAWFDENALPWLIWMVWVVNWILWEHEKAMYVLVQKVISIYNFIEKNKLNKKELETYKSQITSSIKRSQEELNFYIIEKAEENSKECKKNYKCLVKNWYIKQEINTLKNECMKNIDLRHIKGLKDIINTDVKKSLENTKCFLLGLSQAQWIFKDWDLKSIIIKWWTYYYDDNRQIWWVWIRNNN